jgi:hypothetical protein
LIRQSFLSSFKSRYAYPPKSSFLEAKMRRVSLNRLAVAALAGFVLSLPVRIQAQEHVHATSSVSQAQLAAYGKAFAAIATARDAAQAEFAQTRNKTQEAQRQLHDKLFETIAKIIKDNGFTDEQYKQITYAISTDPVLRESFDKLMGFTPPPATASGGAAPMGTVNNAHVNHVTSAFNGTPNGQGLLATTLAEAKIVVDHAALASRNTTSLDAMKTHAGHIIHAIEPAEGSKGPGAGYGLKKAANNVAVHIDMAGKAAGASANIQTHAAHIAASAKNTVTRADQILSLAKQIETATDAAAAAKLVGELNKLAGQLSNGVDANGDGRVNWQEGEGGLAMVEQHVGLLVQGEAPAPAPAAAAPAGGNNMANPHVGHVTTSFNGTPNNQGLLATAMGEAKVVVDHAALAARNNTNLDAMKTHAGHVIYALEPAEGIKSGPGAGYGLKKAATNIATHIELAAKATGAAPAVVTHSQHIAASAKNTVQRSEQLLALAKQIQAATTADDAAKLVDQLNKLAGEMMAGADANGDGRIGWQEGEGGLQLVEQHVNLMVKG